MKIKVMKRNRESKQNKRLKKKEKEEILKLLFKETLRPKDIKNYVTGSSNGLLKLILKLRSTYFSITSISS